MGILVAGAAALAPSAGCAAAAPPPVAVVASAPAPVFQDDPRPLERYRSKRLGISVPLPDGKGWRIDDHTRPELVATHGATDSRVVVAVLREDQLVGRTECEAAARRERLFPVGQLRTLEDTVATTLGDYDTRVWVAVEPGAGPGSPLVGHVVAVGGFLRKCYVFDFSTRVERAADEDALSSRLAFARERILGGLVMDAVGVLPAPTARVPP